MEIYAELGATELFLKNSYIGQFLFNFGINGTDVFRRAIGLHICSPNTHSWPNQGGGGPLSDVSLKKKLKKIKKGGFSNFLTVLPPPHIFFGMLFGKYINFRTYWYHQL